MTENKPTAGDVTAAIKNPIDDVKTCIENTLRRYSQGLPLYQHDLFIVCQAAQDAAGLRERVKELKSYIEELPADWSKDSSLETWFPFTFQEVTRLTEMVKEFERKIDWSTVPYTEILEAKNGIATKVITHKNKEAYLEKEITRLTAELEALDKKMGEVMRNCDAELASLKQQPDAGALVSALELAAKRIHMGAYSLAPLLDSDILATIEQALAAWKERNDGK